jgi:hypothetical protein
MAPAQRALCHPESRGNSVIKLHERLSEFSYGYGVTNETRELLTTVGWHAVPFLPSLIHEKEVGFDVAFSKPGAVLTLQFKLGDQLGRFRRQYPAQPIPALERPFWRFPVHTGEQQFLRLWSFEVMGAEVYYVAPRFSDRDLSPVARLKYLRAYSKVFDWGRARCHSGVFVEAPIVNVTFGGADLDPRAI